MLLRRISLKNFRQFIGEQTVKFSENETKNTTVIMGENGSGKTTFAQAFTWCLYGATDFKDKSVINKIVINNLGLNCEERVKVELELVHGGLEYVVLREQKYKKDSSGRIKEENSVVSISYKNTDGQQEFIKELEVEFKIKEILPKELSSYFFFDGERISDMSKEISKGKSNEFKQAVKKLLGLSAFESALEHLNGVKKNYDRSYDTKNNSKIGILSEKIEKNSNEIENIDRRLEEIESEKCTANNIINDLTIKIRENRDSEELMIRREDTKNRIKESILSKNNCEKQLLKKFNDDGHSFLSKKLISDSLMLLSKNEKIDKGVPELHAKTINYILNANNRSCICGTKIYKDSIEEKKLLELLDYIPPKSIGTIINQFVKECEFRSKKGINFFDEFSNELKMIEDYENYKEELQKDKENIDKKLRGMLNIGELQSKLTTYEKKLDRMNQEAYILNVKKGALLNEIEKSEGDRRALSSKDEKNRRIEIYKTYTEYIYDYLEKEYLNNEKSVRDELEQKVNEIFKKIYNDSFILTLDDRYNIQVSVTEFKNHGSDIETSTAQSISIIFAFIAGVIEMARSKSGSDIEKLITTEPYPLVMDAPLSAFDKKRIRTVCDTIPNIAEQVIMFIKDTDGDLAEKHMENIIGAKYLFKKNSEFETTIMER